MNTIPKKVRGQIEEAIKQKSRAKELEAEAKRLNDAAKETLVPIMNAYGIKDYELQGVGKVISKVSKGSTIVKTSLVENLLLAGISSTATDTIINMSTKSWETPYVEFKQT